VKHIQEAPRATLLIGWGNAPAKNDGVDAPSLRKWRAGLAKPVRDRATQLHARAGPRAGRRPGAVMFVRCDAHAEGGGLGSDGCGWSRSCSASGPAELFSATTPAPAGLLAKLPNTLYGRQPAGLALAVTAHAWASAPAHAATKGFGLPELLAALRRWCSGRCNELALMEGGARALPWRLAAAQGPGGFQP